MCVCVCGGGGGVCMCTHVWGWGMGWSAGGGGGEPRGRTCGRQHRLTSVFTVCFTAGAMTPTPVTRSCGARRRRGSVGRARKVQAALQPRQRPSSPGAAPRPHRVCTRGMCRPTRSPAPHLELGGRHDGARAAHGVAAHQDVADLVILLLAVQVLGGAQGVQDEGGLRWGRGGGGGGGNGVCVYVSVVYVGGWGWGGVDMFLVAVVRIGAGVSRGAAKPGSTARRQKCGSVQTGANRCWPQSNANGRCCRLGPLKHRSPRSSFCVPAAWQAAWRASRQWSPPH